MAWCIMNLFMGEDRYQKVVTNDQRKQIACNALGIELVIVPTFFTHFNKTRKEQLWHAIGAIIRSNAEKFICC